MLQTGPSVTNQNTSSIISSLKLSSLVDAPINQSSKRSVQVFNKKLSNDRFNLSAHKSKQSDDDSVQTSDQKTRQHTHHFDSSKYASLLGVQLAPDAEEVKSLYVDKSGDEIVRTLLKHLSSSTVLNKNEHIVQFLSLLFKQAFRLKLD